MTNDFLELDVEPAYSDPVLLEGRYEVDPVPGGKRLQGSWLVLDDGSRYVISYRPVPEYFQFIDKRVRVEGRPYVPGSDTQQVMTTHLAVERIELAPGETPYSSPPVEVPAPPLAGSIEAIAAREGRWVCVRGALEAVNDDPDGYLGVAVLRLANGERVRARNVGKAEWSRHVGRAVTVTSRAGADEGGQAELVGWYAIDADGMTDMNRQD